jgi:hypothetical protein
MTRFDALADQVAAALDIDDAILDGEIDLAYLPILGRRSGTRGCVSGRPSNR